jgi:hypothetical protein
MIGVCTLAFLLGASSMYCGVQWAYEDYVLIKRESMVHILLALNSCLDALPKQREL